jgi:hypothetical protein
LSLPCARLQGSVGEGAFVRHYDAHFKHLRRHVQRFEHASGGNAARVGGARLRARDRPRNAKADARSHQILAAAAGSRCPKYPHETPAHALLGIGQVGLKRREVRNVGSTGQQLG